MKSPNELFETILKNTTDDIYVLNPCEVVTVDGNYVDVKIYVNDEYPDMILYHVPIQRQETQRAYIFLGIKKGDRGTLKFFDRSTEGYLQSDFDYNSDDRQHDINDRAFELGFIPDKEAYVYFTETKSATVDEIIPNFNSDDFNTPLTTEEEEQYQEWYADMVEQGYIQESDIGYDYDFRGAFKAGFQPSEVGGHWLDTWKKPNHQTFSVESIYATGKYRQYAGSWDSNDNYIMPSSRVIEVEPPEIEIGLKNGNAKISIDASGNINIYSVDNITVKSGVGITLDSPDVTTTGNLSAGNGKSGMYATQSGVLTFSNGILTAST